jgi:hypothetical protein
VAEQCVSAQAAGWMKFSIRGVAAQLSSRGCHMVQLASELTKPYDVL